MTDRDEDALSRWSRLKRESKSGQPKSGDDLAPCVGPTKGLRQWVEFDTWGQFWGLGFFPVAVVEDMQRRMRLQARPADENIEIIFPEKRAALEVKELPEILNPETLGPPDEMVRELKTILRFHEISLRGYELCCRAVYLARKAELSGTAGDVGSARGPAVAQGVLSRTGGATREHRLSASRLLAPR